MPALTFAGWTLFVWGGRLRNLIGEPGGVGDVSRWSLAGSIGFTALAVVTLVAVVFLRHRRLAPILIAGLAVASVGVWAMRLVAIAGGGHGAAFVAVHSALAAVSVALGWWALSSQGFYPFRSVSAAKTSGARRSNQDPADRAAKRNTPTP